MKYYLYGENLYSSENLNECIERFFKHNPFKNKDFDYKALGIEFKIEDNELPSSIDLIILKDNNLLISNDFKTLKIKNKNIIDDVIESFNKKYNLKLSYN
ncbi:hypothetical protein BFS06_11955 [Clostridium perfringens]|uniref:Uncharacterized protein n=1 Tax=Clostridium perfringens TaxID=1502 RepID=A0A140GQV8_CLOPF|nr:hypothetical protein [Clostridium perfringens]AMN30917.1 hypothetical protein JFP838_pA0001 [Clostridium perfringens]TBX14916.1 hypothetical protein BFS06_11955 [Clostridium perfringens]